jgi:hypothetical protein
MKGGFQRGMKLCSASSVARRKKLVATSQSSPWAKAISWMRMSPVKCLLRGRKQASCLPLGSTFGAAAGKFAQLLDRPGLDVGRREPVAIPLAVLGLELEDAVEDRALRAEDGPSARERAKQRSPSRSRRGGDEHRPFDHGAQSLI